METARVFIAVDLGDVLRVRLAGLQQKLKPARADIRWVKPESMHLTVAFLGELPVEKIIALKNALDKDLREVEAFSLHVAGTGFFGKPRHPGVIWAGIADCPPLMELQQKILISLQRIEIKRSDKPFMPHITLGRIKAPDYRAALLDKLEACRQEPLGQTRIDRVDLIQSRLTPGGAEYTVLHRVPLCFPASGKP